MKKLVAAILALVVAWPALAGDSICFEDPVARRLLADVEVAEVTAKRLAVCDSQAAILRAAIKEEQAKSAALEKDKAALVQASDKFRGLAEQGNDALTSCEASKPSRLTWFALGGLAALLAVVGGAAAMK